MQGTTWVHVARLPPPCPPRVEGLRRVGGSPVRRLGSTQVARPELEQPAEGSSVPSLCRRALAAGWLVTSRQAISVPSWPARPWGVQLHAVSKSRRPHAASKGRRLLSVQ